MALTDEKKDLQERFPDEEHLLEEIDKIIGKSFKEIDKNNLLDNPNNKGKLGQIIEESVFGYPINSDARADFDYLNLELKTTGIRINKNKSKFSAKERLALSNINYFDAINESFEESHVWKKTQNLLLIIYEYIDGIEEKDMVIKAGFIHHMSDVDKKLIEQDYEKIVEKIREGKAHELSESDTMYLGACTAGAGHGKTIAQPNSNIGAKPRKFALKASFLTKIIQDYLKPSESENIITGSELEHNTFEDYLIHTLSKYYGRGLSSLMREFSLENVSSKALNNILVSRMLGIKGSVNASDEFQKANIKVKTIRVNEKGNIKESMSFPKFDFIKVANTPFEESAFREMLETEKYLFVVFEEKNNENVLSKAMFWNAPEPIIEENAEKVYTKTAEILRQGNVIREIKDGRYLNNFPGIKDDEIFHVRPHARVAADTLDLPVPDKLTGITSYTKQCFWINNSYIKKLIK